MLSQHAGLVISATAAGCLIRGMSGTRLIPPACQQLSAAAFANIRPMSRGPFLGLNRTVPHSDSRNIQAGGSRISYWRLQKSRQRAIVACMAAQVKEASTGQDVGGAASSDTDEDLDFEDEDDGDSYLDVADDEGDAIIDADRTSWGRKALEIAQKVLSSPAMEGLELYSFRAIASGNQLDIRLDKPEDQYGPMLDEVTDFSRQFAQELTATLGEEAAGAISIQVSSPGAERTIRVPRELERFKELPMTVTYAMDGDASRCDTQVLQLCHFDEEEATTEWQLANVRSNRPKGKGTKLTKKQGLQRFKIPLSSLQKVRLYLDV